MAAIRFLLNGRTHEETRLPATTTVLDYLRHHVGLTGTKEGCAEGDCGACTIAIKRGDAPYQAANACLMVVPQLDGASVLTVEGLADTDGTLHPVQQALVDTDGTQCGFCTPGFAMAMFAFQQAGEPPNNETIHEALAGNLCRCTGYRPIVDACRRIAGIPGTRTFPSAPTFETCTEYPGYLAPETADELAAILAREPDAKILGGGTDLGLLFSRERQTLPLLVSTARVAGLADIVDTGTALEIGGAATYSAALPHIEALYPSFGALIRRIGSRQIRNLGTIAGNIANASPIGDTIPCLMALGATVTARSQSGTRAIAMDDFIAGYRKTALHPGEFIEKIAIPNPKPGEIFAAYKISKRFDQDISAVVAAFVLSIENGTLAALRAAYGGMAEKGARATHLESGLVGKPWNQTALADVAAMLAKDFAPLDDHRASAAYRRLIAANLVRRLCAETSGSSAPRLEAL